MKRICRYGFAVLVTIALAGCPSPVAPPAAPTPAAPAAPAPPALSSTARWAKTVVSGADESRFNGIAADDLGHTYAVGGIRGTGEFDFGNGVKAKGTSTYLNIVIVKYDPDGKALWARTVVSGAAETVFNGVAVNGLGDIFAVGTIRNHISMDFGNTQTAIGSLTWDRNVLIVKYNSSGDTQWARTTTASPNYAWYAGVAVDNNGNAYTVGSITASGAYNFGNSITASGPNSFYHTIIVKYNSSGNAQWAKTVTASSNFCEFTAVACDGEGNLAAVGHLEGFKSFDFGNGKTVVYADGGGYIPVIVKYDNGGTTLWAKTVESAPNSCIFYGVTRDSSNNLYAVGSALTTDTYGFGNSVTVAGSFDSQDNALIVKYDAGGTAQWARSTTSGSEESTYYGVSADASGNIWAAGFIRGAGSFGFGGDATARGTDTRQNPVIVKYDSAGAAKKAYTIESGTSTAEPGCIYRGVSTDNLNRPHVAGTLSRDVVYGFGNGVTAKGAVTDKPSSLVVQYP